MPVYGQLKAVPEPRYGELSTTVVSCPRAAGTLMNRARAERTINRPRNGVSLRSMCDAPLRCVRSSGNPGSRRACVRTALFHPQDVRSKILKIRSERYKQKIE